MAQETINEVVVAAAMRWAASEPESESESESEPAANDVNPRAPSGPHAHGERRLLLSNKQHQAWICLSDGSRTEELRALEN